MVLNLQLERFPFMKNGKFYKVLRDIFFPFCLKFMSKLFRSRIDDRLIIMGVYSGNSYLDNTKYLFEFLNNYYPSLPFCFGRYFKNYKSY